MTMCFFLDCSYGLLRYAGVASGVLSVFAFLPYIKNTLRADTRPQRASWLIWSVLGSIAFFAQLYEGANDSLWFAGVQVGGTIIIFLLSIRFGVGGFLNLRDSAVLCVAAFGLVIWYFTEDAAYALMISISISLLGGIVTIAKAYEHPESETLTSWAISLAASSLAIMSLHDADWLMLAYPAYLFTLNGAIVLAILFGRKKPYLLTRVVYETGVA